MVKLLQISNPERSWTLNVAPVEGALVYLDFVLGYECPLLSALRPTALPTPLAFGVLGWTVGALPILTRPPRLASRRGCDGVTGILLAGEQKTSQRMESAIVKGNGIDSNHEPGTATSAMKEYSHLICILTGNMTGSLAMYTQYIFTVTYLFTHTVYFMCIFYINIHDCVHCTQQKG